MPGRIVKPWRAPLVHFLLLGGALFALRSSVSGDAAQARRVVVVPAAELARIESEALRQTGRAPGAAELDARVAAWVDDELLLREARARGWHRSDPVVRARLVRNLRFLGAEPEADDATLLAQAFEMELDRSDVVVRRRLAGRMRLALAGAARAASPSDAELEALLERESDRFREPARARLTQVFLSRDRRGDALDAEAEALLAELRASGVGPAQAAAMGDPSLLPAALPLSSEQELAARFGPGFARRAAGLEPGTWQGPVPSSYGLHLVWVHERREARAPGLDEVRASVRALWLAEREREAVREALTRLRSTVEIRVESAS